MPRMPRSVSRPPRWLRKTAGSSRTTGALGQVALQRFGGLAGQRHLALLAALAAHAHPALGAVEIVEVQPGQFADAHAAAVEQLEDGAVARRMRPLQLARGDTPSISALACSAVITSGSFLGALGVRTRRATLIGDHAFAQHEAEEPAHAPPACAGW